MYTLNAKMDLVNRFGQYVNKSKHLYVEGQYFLMLFFHIDVVIKITYN